MSPTQTVFMCEVCDKRILYDFESETYLYHKH